MSLMSFEALEALKNTLAGIDGVTTCRIGFEAGICPTDYPIIRVVPQTSEALGFSGEKIECKIYYGHPIDESTKKEGEDEEVMTLEDVYKKQLALRDEILIRLQYPEETPLHSAVYKGTIFDDDRIAAYKISCLLVDLAF